MHIYICILFWVLITFVVVDGYAFVKFNMIHQNGMNSRRKLHVLPLSYNYRRDVSKSYVAIEPG